MRLHKNKFLENTSWIFFSQLFYLGISFFVSAYAARVLGPDQIGIMDLSNNYISIFLIIASLGIDTIIVKDIVGGGDIGEIIGSSFLMKFVASIACMIGLNIFFYVNESQLVFVVCFIQSFMLIFRLYSVYDLYYQSKLESKNIVQVRCITSVVFAVFRVVVLITTSSLVLYVIFTTLEYLGCFLLCRMKFLKTGIRLKFSSKVCRDLIKQGYHFILSDMLVMIYTRIDKIMLEYFRGVTELGIYAIATLIAELWMVLPNAIITSARPKILEYRDVNYEEYIKKLKQLYAAIFYLGVAVCVGIALVVKYIVLILYGDAYLLATQPIIILSVSTIFATLGSARSIWIVGENLQRYTKKYIAAGAFVNVILNLILIRPFGMNGVAIATLISQIVVALVAPVFIRETKESTIIMLNAIFLKGLFKGNGNGNKREV